MYHPKFGYNTYFQKYSKMTYGSFFNSLKAEYDVLIPGAISKPLINKYKYVTKSFPSTYKNK